MEYPNFNEEKKLWKRGYKYVAGLDEAGRGPLAGPVVAGATCFKHDRNRVSIETRFRGIKDSKQLSSKKREEIYNILINHPQIKWGIGVVSEKVIDKINILEATKLAMIKAVRNLENKLNKENSHGRICISRDKGSSERFSHVDFLILDGNFKIKSKIPQKSIIKGDQKVFSCAAASIIAKVYRDRLMLKYHKKYPQYGFDKHKGYPTVLHRQRIRKYGFCRIHRKTFHF